MTDALAGLELQLPRDLGYVDFPTTPWVKPRSDAGGSPVLDVLIQGAGMQGLAIAHALRREQITNVLVIDESLQGRERPWGTYARMHYLRTPKNFVGPDLGLRSLSYRVWFNAKHGAGAWDDLDRVPTDSWTEYLHWYRRVLQLPVVNETRLTLVERGEAGLIKVSLMRDGVPQTLSCRILVRATGILGSGGKAIPGVIERGLSPDRYAHTSDHIDFGALKDKNVAVLGAGASAFDNAATALETGAARVDMFMRRAALPTVKITTAMKLPGLPEAFC